MVDTYGLHRRLEYVFVLFLGIIGLDQFTKFLAQKFLPMKYVIIEHVFWLTYVENFGAGFGILKGQSFLLGIIGVLIAIGLVILVYTQKLSFLENAAYSLVMAGALGNAIDRFVFGYVIDFLDLGWWPVFNIADISLVVGVTLLLYHSLSNSNAATVKKKQSKNDSSSKKSNAFKLDTYK